MTLVSPRELPPGREAAHLTFVYTSLALPLPLPLTLHVHVLEYAPPASSIRTLASAEFAPI